MSVQDARGRQVQPESDDSATVVVRFGRYVTRTTAAEVCARLGIALDVFDESLAELVDRGWLMPQADGSYTAAADAGTMAEADT